MALLSAERISALAVELLARSIVLPATVSRVPGSDYTGSGGLTVIRVPRHRTAKVVAGNLTYDVVSEDPVNVQLARWYDGVKVTTDESSLQIVEFGRQIIAPMLQGIAEAGENVLAAKMNAVTPTFSWQDLADAAKVRSDILAIRERLTLYGVPAANRTLAVSPDVATAILKVPDFVKANEAGSADALRNAQIGRVFGLDVVESNALSPGSGLGYHRSAFAFATLAPALPQGGAAAASSSAEGIAVRTVFAYDTATGGDVILLDTYGGAVEVANPLITPLTSVAATDLFTHVAHGLVAGDAIKFHTLTGGAGLVNGRTYYVIAAGLTDDVFAVSATPGGASFDHSTNVTAGSFFLAGNGPRVIRVA